MNKPYTCHNCGTTFDVYPDDIKEQFEQMGMEPPEKIKIKCPGCFDNGYPSLSQRVYVINTKTMTLVV